MTMDRNSVMRGTLWTTTALNLGVAMIVAFPSSTLGQLAGLPGSVPVLYRSLLACLIALFGFAYGWLACQSRIDRPLVVVGAAGKLGVVVIALACWLGGEVSGRIPLLAGGDLLFAAIFVWWLVGERREAVRAPLPAGR